MSGQEKDRDAVLRLWSELKGHTGGELRRPAEFIHRLELENCSVCDLWVEFTASPATPDTSLVSYAPTTPWSDELDLAGSSKSRRHREDARERQIRVQPCPDAGGTRQREDLDVRTTFRWKSPDGLGPPERSVSVRHRLTLV